MQFEAIEGNLSKSKFAILDKGVKVGELTCSNLGYRFRTQNGIDVRDENLMVGLKQFEEAFREHHIDVVKKMMANGDKIAAIRYYRDNVAIGHVTLWAAKTAVEILATKN